MFSSCEFGCYHYHPLQKESCPQGSARQVVESDWSVSFEKIEGRVLHAGVEKCGLVGKCDPAVSQYLEWTVQIEIWEKN